MTHYNRSNLWKLTLALLVVVFCVTLTVGVFAFAASVDESIDHITVELDGDLYSDYDASTIKDALTVMSYTSKDNSEGTKLGSMRYGVSFSGDGYVGFKLVAGKEVTITVTHHDNGNKTASITATVVAPTITARLVVPGYSKVGNYYVNSKGYDAFVQGMTKQQVEERLAIELASNNPFVAPRVVTFANGVKWQDEDAVPEIFGDDTSTTNWSENISLKYKDNVYGDFAVSETINFNTLHEFALVLGSGWKQPTDKEWTSATPMSEVVPSLQGYVYIAYNNGVLHTDPVTVSQCLSTSGAIGVTAIALENDKVDSTYSISVEIEGIGTCNGLQPLVLPLKNVKYVRPDKVDNEIKSELNEDGSPKMHNQVARSEELDYGGLYIDVTYGTGRNARVVKVSVTDIIESKVPVTNLVYYTDDGESSILSRQVNWIEFDLGEYYFSGRVFVAAISTARPTMKYDNEEVTFSDDLYTEIKGLVLDDEQDDNMKLTLPDGVTQQDDGTFKFAGGGEYVFKVTFEKGDKSDFYWSNYGGGSLTDGNNTVEYTITVLGAELDLTLNYNTELQYGDDEPNFANIVSGVVANSPKMNMEPLTDRLTADTPVFDDSNPNDELTKCPRYRVIYTKSDGTTYTDKYKFPTELGSYHVYIETEPTSYYKKATAEADFEIVERKISLGDIDIPAVEYQRGKSYTLSEVLSTVTVGNLVNPDDKNTVLDWAFASSTAPEHVGKYPINFTIKNKNYRWDTTTNATIKKDFEITALNYGLDLRLTDDSFTYGEVQFYEILQRKKDTVDVESFYAVVNDVAYYKVNDDNSETLMTDTLFNTWDVGNYKVKYTTSVDTDNGDVAGDYNLPEIEQSFVIEKRAISHIKLDKDSATFDADGINFAIVINADGSALNVGELVNDHTYADVLTVTKVSALLMDNSTNVDDRRITIPSNDDFNGNNITAIDAGNYTFKVTLNTNYTWGLAPNDDGIEEKELTFTINKATVEIKWAETSDGVATAWTNAISYEYDGEAHYPTLSAQDGLTLAYHFTYVDGDNTVTVSVANAATLIKDARTYGVVVTDFIGDALEDASYTLDVNYELPTTLEQSFVIVSLGMAKPTLTGTGVSGNTVTVVYNGVAVDFTTFIENYNKAPNEGGYVLGSTPMLTITFDGSANAPKDVKGTGAEEEYTVTIVPAGNFVWGEYDESDTEEVTFTLTITRLPIVITWDDDTFDNTKGNYIYNGDAQTVALNTNYTLNNQASDVIDVTFAYTGTKISVNGEAIDAGSYTVTLNGITGELANNYTIAGATNNEHALTIAQFAINAPVFADSNTLTFNGNPQTKALTLNDYTSAVTGFDWNYVLDVTISGAWTFDNVEYKAHAAYNASSVAYNDNNAQATFTFTNAGTYALSFSIIDGNYAWADGEQAKAESLTFDVARDTLTAPALGANRAMEKEKAITDLSGLFGTSKDGVAFSVMYGKMTITEVGDVKTAAYGVADSATQLGGMTSETAEIGQYFALLQISGDNAYNYVWTVEYDNNGATAFVGDGFITPKVAGESVYRVVYTQESGAAVYLRYAITASQMTIDFEIGSFGIDNGYMFGANGVSFGATANSDILRLDKFITLTGSTGDKNTIVNNIGNGVIITYKFTVQGSADAIDSQLLPNGLPWAVGSYSVAIEVKFEDKLSNEGVNLHEMYQDLTFSKNFTVAPRPIEVAWTFGEGEDLSTTLSTTYNGNAQGVVATITNIPKSNVEELDNLINVNLTWTYNNSATVPTNAGTYTVKVEGIEGDGANNLTIEGELTDTFVINAIEVTVTANSPASDHIYGNAIVKAYESLYDVTSGEFLTGENKVVTQIMNGNALYQRTDSVGTYTVLPTWNGTLKPTNGKIDAGNYVITVNTANFVVVPREITVTLLSGATSVYGAAVTLGTENTVFGVEWTNKLSGQLDGEWWVGTGSKNYTTVFTLSSDANNTKPVGNYPVVLSQVDKNNYVISGVVDGEATLGNWVITNANITNVTVQAVETAPTYKGSGYNIIGDLLTVDYTLTRRSDNLTSVKWYYIIADNLDAAKAADKDAWTEITSAQQIDAINQSYYFKITADNHNDFIVATPCSVVVQKATLKVQINLSIWYGEADPANYLGTNVAYNATVAELLKANTDGSMYTVTGFMTRDGSLETIGSIGIKNDATFHYTTSYNQYDDAGAYSITFVNDTLETTNYVFENENEDGVLEVKKLELTVQINDVVNTYHQQYSDVTFVTVVTLPNSTYDPTKSLKDDTANDVYSAIYAESNAYVGANVITLTTTAFDDTDSSTYTNNVGDYDISGSVNDETNYTATFSGSKGATANHKINKATFTLNTIEGYSAAYDEKTHKLLSVSDSVNYADPSDGANVNVLYYVIDLGDNGFDATNIAGKWTGFEQSLVSSVVPTEIDVCHKAVYFRVEDVNGNYEVVYGAVEAAITKTTNQITNGDDIKIVGWTYGLYSATNTDGYSSASNLGEEPKAEFNRDTDKADDKNIFIVTIAREDGTEIGLSGSYNTIKGLFDAMWADGLFNVGKYVVTIEMKGTKNYGGITATRDFTVTPKKLTITANNQTVVYGYDFTAGYTYEVTGYVVSDTTNGALETAEIAFAGMSSTDFFTTAYKKGRVDGSVGTYGIATTANAIDDKGNYTFTYVTTDKALTVTPRPITISIGDYSNQYNEASAVGKVLTYSFVDNCEFYEYDADNVIVLRTLAIAGYGLEASDLSATTNNVIVVGRNTYGQAETYAAYPVYVVWGSQAKGNGKDEYNYTITVNGSYNRELSNYKSPCDADKIIEVKIDGDTPIGGGAGSYLINRALLGITYNGVYHLVPSNEVTNPDEKWIKVVVDDVEYIEVPGLVYSGAVNYYKATPTDSSVQMTFSYGYNKTTKGNYVDITADNPVVNVGYYIAYGRLTSDNYYDAAANQEFEITQATVTLTADPASVQYGATLNESNPADKLDGRFSGFTYTYDKGTLLQSVYDAYIDNVYKVTYTTDGYAANTSAGTQNLHVIPVCDNSADATGNIKIYTVGAALTVDKRNVVVTVYGYGDAENNNLAQCDYLGTAPATQSTLVSIYTSNWDKFIAVDNQGDSGDGLDKLGVSFSLNGAYNAATYGMGVTSSSNSNYSVTFKTSEGRTTATILSGDEDAPKFVINKAKLTIYAHTNVNNGTPDAYTVIYGNNLVYNNRNNANDINFSVAGMQNNESFSTLSGNKMPTYTVKLQGGSKLYAAWESNVGETYVVSVDPFDLTLQNYELNPDNGATYVDTTLTINKRTIAVSTEKQIFTWNGGANGGAYGIAHEAVLTYSDTLTVDNAAINNNINSEYRPVCSVRYNTSPDSSYNQAEGAAPTRVGDYEVTVTLANGNYTFANNSSQAKIDFSVTKLVISESDLAWDKPAIAWSDDPNFAQLNEITQYINEVMEIVVIAFAPYGQSGSRSVDYDASGAAGTYRFDGQKLVLNANERGTYEVRFQLKSTATHNYEFDSSNSPWVISRFVVTSTTIDMTLTIADWTYGKTPNAPEVTVNGATSGGVIYTYARVTDVSNINDYYGKGQLSGITGLKVGNSTSITGITFNAGYYVVRASYTGLANNEAGEQEETTVTAYYVFNVSKATVTLPKAVTKGYTFNGAEQTLSIEYLTNLVRASYDGRTSINADGIDVYATDAKTYTITFTLVDSANYEWEVGGIAPHQLSWTIAQDESSNLDSNILTIDKLDFESTYGDVAVTGATVASGYGSASDVVRYFVGADQGAFETIEQWASTVTWSNGLPENAGSYYVKLVLNGNDNFTDKETFVKLTVVPYVIEVAASGTITYGNANWQSAVHYDEVEGLYGHRVIGTATYKLVEDYGTLQAGGDYYVIVDHDENGVANGLTMSNNAGANYVIKAVQGRLTVNKRNVTVTLGNESSQYGRPIDVSNVTKTTGLNQLIPGDSLNLELYVENTQSGVNSPVGGYIINAYYSNDNYNVTINPGTYTITARRISIEVVQGGGTYGGEINPVKLSKVLDDEDIDIKEFVEINNVELSIYYVGLANDSTSYNDTVKPSKAGTYTATVRGSENANFVIVGEVSTSFVINKKVVDGSKITIANQTYSSAALTPVLNDDEFVNLYGAELYEEVARTVEFVNAGTYAVTLKIKDFANYKWQSVEIENCDISFTIDKADNDLTSDIAIAGWTYREYSADSNLPSATVKFGQSSITFVYSNSIDGTYTSGAPETGDVGDYWVKVTVPATDNYNAYTSAPVKFTIVKKALAQPTLTIVTDGEGKNDTYTGEQLTTAINGYEMALMNLVYDDINVSDGQIIARAINAGTYTIKLSIANTKNYCWQGTDNNEITLTWTIAPKAIAKPTANTDRFIVNGQLLTYIPEGFDEETMTISGNQTAYGGDFPVTIGLKDTANYVWADGGVKDFTLTWSIVGINTVFIIVASTIGGASAIALMAIGIQLLLDHRRRRLIDLAIDARSQAEAWENPAKPQTNETSEEGGND